MVTKLLLATQESYFDALEQNAPQATIQALAAAYYDIRQGLSFNKTPDGYGAFPTDPYSHTPAGQGAKQPGMTGQVKEEIVARFSELGLQIEQGIISFKPVLLRAREFSTQPVSASYIDMAGKKKKLSLPASALMYTFCQVPVVYTFAAEEKIELTLADGSTHSMSGHALDAEQSEHIFHRDGQIRQVTFYCTRPALSYCFLQK
jgi:hypothetical protein